MYDTERKHGYRYLVLDREGRVLFKYVHGTRFQWDFTLPGPAQGGRVIDLNKHTD